MEKIILLILLVPFFSNANELSCPENGYVVTYRSPTSGNKISFCQIKINGERLKHGLEIIYNDAGELIDQRFYKNGEEVLPQGEKILTDEIVKESSFDRAASLIKSILSSMIVFDPEDESHLKTKGCKNYVKKWMRVFISNKKETFKYKFGDSCDIEGVFLASEKNIKVNLSLRNVGEFERVSMDVPFNVVLGTRPKVIFKLKNGVFLSKGKKKSEFSGNYELIVDPFKKSLIHKDLEGNFI